MAKSSAVRDIQAQGSTHEGVEHWKLQRLTAIANIPLVLWFTISMIGLSGSGYAEVRSWLAAPLNTIFMVLLVLSIFWHARLGLQVVIEDYVHARPVKIASLVALNLSTLALIAAALVAILKTSLGN